MDTIPEPFTLRNPTGVEPARRSGFRVPFGVRDGRTWAPDEVARGKACGCVCPGCHAPLAAKAQESRRKRPHFAHLTDTGCQTGLETGIHLRAKQLIDDHRELLLPAWAGDPVDRPNPPVAWDDDGHLHRGRLIERPTRRAQLSSVALESSLDGYKPDVRAHDESGELLIEIRVTHAVDDNKAARVQAQGRRMVEIDLSRLHRDTPHDQSAFEHAVLFNAANRSWISYPEAVAAWGNSKRELDDQVRTRNAEIAQHREALASAAQARRERETRDAKDKEARKAHIRKLKREMHADDLAQLSALTSPDRIRQLLHAYQVNAEGRVSELLETASPPVRSACLRAHEDAWVFGVDPVLWQLLVYNQFVARQLPGHRFNQRDVATWVRRSFHPEPALYRLFVAQYTSRAEARRAGYHKRQLAYWVFTEEENARIPNFYTPVNELIDRLVSARVIRHLPSPIGECEVVAPPASGFIPVATVDVGCQRGDGRPSVRE